MEKNEIEYEQRKTFVFSILCMILVIFISPILMKDFYASITEYELISFSDFFNFLFSNAIRDPYFLGFILFDILIIISARAYARGLSIVDYSRQVLKDIKKKTKITNPNENLRWILILNGVASAIIILFYFFNPIATPYIIYIWLVTDGYMIGNYVGIFLFRKTSR